MSFEISRSGCAMMGAGRHVRTACRGMSSVISEYYFWICEPVYCNWYLPMVTHTTEDAITTNCTNVLTYKRNTLHYIRCYERSLLQKERLLQKDQCFNLQKVHFVLQKDTPGVCHQLYERPIWRRHESADLSLGTTSPSFLRQGRGGTALAVVTQW